MHDLPETNDSLLVRVRDADNDVAWAEFLAVYRPAVYRLARGRGLQDADAEDLTQKVFLAVAGAIERWEPGDGKPPFRAWLYRIAHNEILKAVTRKKPDVAAGSSSVQAQLQQIPDAETAITEAFVREARQAAFRWAARQIRDEFTEPTWAMFWGSCVEGIPIADVAKLHGKSVGAVYIARSRVMQRIKRKVTEFTETWSDTP